MAFITYILLAGMALGIQKRFVSASSVVFMTHWWHLRFKLKAYVLFLKVQSWGTGTVCQHCPRVGHHWGLGDAVEFVSADSAQWPLHPWPYCLQWIQIRWVNVILLSVCVTYSSAVVIWRHDRNENTPVYLLFTRMIFTMMCGLMFGSDGYYVGLAWASCALMFFIVSVFYSNLLAHCSSICLFCSCLLYSCLVQYQNQFL